MNIDWYSNKFTGLVEGVIIAVTPSHYITEVNGEKQYWNRDYYRRGTNDYSHST